MKIKMRLIQTFQRSALVGLVALGLVAGASWTQAKQMPFSHLPVFGDSLSDIGNLFRLTGGYPPPPYFQGHFCNGPIWVEYLADCLGMPEVPEENFAVGGATTGNANYNDGMFGTNYPGLQNEIDSFLASEPISEPARALYIVQAGPNDFGVALKTGAASPAVLIANGVSNTVFAVQRLWNSGARIIMVMNVPDLGVTPMAQALGPQGPAMLTQLSAAYNQVLELSLQSLDQAGIPTIRLDAFTVVDKMYYSPATYGFTNVTIPWLYDLNPGNPDQYLFWDQWHPTTRAHKVLADEAAQQLMNTFSPSQGNASLNGLHGLVNAWVQRSAH
jgi:phospholipase/lecithinase/hemolysin